MSLSATTCTHQQQVTYCKYVNCVLCGAILSQPDSHSNTAQTTSISSSNLGVVKDEQYNTRSDVPTSLLYSTMLNDQYTMRFYNPTAQYLKVRNRLAFHNCM